MTPNNSNDNFGNSAGSDWQKEEQVWCRFGDGPAPYYRARIVDMQDGGASAYGPSLLIHYEGWTTRHDEWIGATEVGDRLEKWAHDEEGGVSAGDGWKKGARVWCLAPKSRGAYYKARVAEVFNGAPGDAPRYLIHHEGWENDEDEWIDEIAAGKRLKKWAEGGTSAKNTIISNKFTLKENNRKGAAPSNSTGGSSSKADEKNRLTSAKKTLQWQLISKGFAAKPLANNSKVATPSNTTGDSSSSMVAMKRGPSPVEEEAMSPSPTSIIANKRVRFERGKEDAIAQDTVPVAMLKQNLEKKKGLVVNFKKAMSNMLEYAKRGF